MKKEVIGITEKVTIKGTAKAIKVLAKIDTGAEYNSINEGLAQRLGLVHNEKHIRIRAASGSQKRRTTYAVLKINGRKIRALFTITDRSHMKYQVLIGTRTLKGRFLIDPSVRQ